MALRRKMFEETIQEINGTPEHSIFTPSGGNKVYNRLVKIIHQYDDLLIHTVILAVKVRILLNHAYEIFDC